MAKDTPREELVRLYNQERLKEEAAIGISMLMEGDGVTRTDLANRLGTYKSFISKILRKNQDHNFTLETLADVFWALGYAVHLTLSPEFERMRKPVIEPSTNLRVNQRASVFEAAGATVPQNSARQAQGQSLAIAEA